MRVCVYACMMYRNLRSDTSDTSEGADLENYIYSYKLRVDFHSQCFIENGTGGLLPSRKQHTSRS